jgi:MFS family permease
VIGRRWSFNLTCLISGVFGIASGGSPSFTALRVLVAFVGVGVGGNIPIDATITLEILPTNRRFLLAMLSLFQPVGVLVASGIAYGFIPAYSCGAGEAETASTCRAEDNMGWRYYLYTLGAITMFIFIARFVLFRFRESPAYLINRGSDEQAIQSVTNIAKTNKHPAPHFSLDDFQEIERRCAHANEEESQSARENKPSHIQFLMYTLRDVAIQLKSIKLLFANKTMFRITTLLWITFAADYFGFSIAGTYLPQILVDRGVSNNVSLSETYRDYLAIYAPGIAACLLAAYMIEIPRFGRQWSMVVASALMAISMFIYTTVSSQAGSVGLNAMEYFFQSLFNAVLYTILPESYPSNIRGTASGITATVGRIASIVAPIAAGSLYGPGGESAARNTLYLAGGVTLICPVALALLPYDTRGVRTY